MVSATGRISPLYPNAFKKLSSGTKRSLRSESA
jgi:hypothetical protein